MFFVLSAVLLCALPSALEAAVTVPWFVPSEDQLPTVFGTRDASGKVTVKFDCQGPHNVIRVSNSDFAACTTTASGSQVVSARCNRGDVVSVDVSAASDYFICTFSGGGGELAPGVPATSGHCKLGMKVRVDTFPTGTAYQMSWPVSDLPAVTIQQAAAPHAIKIVCAGAGANVIQVNRAGYDACDATGVAATSILSKGCASGEVVSVNVAAGSVPPGTVFYFISTAGGSGETSPGSGVPAKAASCTPGTAVRAAITVAGSTSPGTSQFNSGASLAIAAPALAASLLASLLI